MKLNIVTWNINSVRLRLDQVNKLGKLAMADILCLQEIKVVDELFPHDGLKSLFPHRAVRGMKAYNGVAILSKLPLPCREPARLVRPRRCPSCQRQCRSGQGGQDRGA